MIFGLTVALMGASPNYFMETGSFLTFSAAPAFEATYTEVQVGALKTNEERPHYWFRRQVISRQDGEALETKWTDSTLCEGAEAIIDSAAGVAPPVISIPGRAVRPDRAFVITADGVRYRFRADAHYSGRIGSDLEFSSNLGTPLAEWAERSLDLLEDCWSADRPFYDGTGV